MSEITGRAAALAKLVSELPDHLTPDPLLSADREREDELAASRLLLLASRLRDGQTPNEAVGLEADMVADDLTLLIDRLSAQPAPDALRALSEAATPGPWAQNRNGSAWDGTIIEGTGLGYAIARCMKRDLRAGAGEANAAFIVAAVNFVRTALPSPETTPAPDALRAARKAISDRYDDLRWCGKDDLCHIKAEGAELALSDFDAALSSPETTPAPDAGDGAVDRVLAALSREFPGFGGIKGRRDVAARILAAALPQPGEPT